MAQMTGAPAGIHRSSPKELMLGNHI